MQVRVPKYCNRVANMTRKRTCIFVFSVKLSDLLKLLQLNGPQTLAPTKNDFSLSPFSLN